VPGDHGDEVLLWESATGKLLAKIPGAYAAFSPDAQLLATARRGPKGQGSITLWKAAKGKEVRSVQVPEGHVYHLAFSPDGRALAAVSDVVGRANKHTIHLWPLVQDRSPKTGSRLRVGPHRLVAEGLSYQVRAVGFSPDGRTLAIPEPSGTVRVLETATGKERICFAGHFGQVWALTFSPDGRRLASGSEDTTILVWDVTGRLRGGRLRPAPLSAKEREKLWADLADADAGRAGRALWTLAADAARVVPFLAVRLRPVAPLAPAAAAKLIRDLDDRAFKVRFKARAQLEKLGAVAEPALRQARQTTDSLEVRLSLDKLLAAVEAQRKRPSANVLRGLRAVEVLEQIGTRDAQRILRTLASGAPAAPLTQEAQVALERLGRTGKRPMSR
jgi:hypothetical protein